MREPSPSSPPSSAVPPLKSSRSAPPPGEPTALELVRALLHDIPRMISERVQLLALELKRARQALVVIAALVVVAVLMLFTAWFVLWGSVIAALIAVGLAWGWAVLIVLVVNLAVAVAALLYASSLSRFLALPATMRHLTLATHDPGTAQPAPFTTGAATPGASAAGAATGYAPGTGPYVSAAADPTAGKTAP